LRPVGLHYGSTYGANFAAEINLKTAIIHVKTAVYADVNGEMYSE